MKRSNKIDANTGTRGLHFDTDALAPVPTNQVPPAAAATIHSEAEQWLVTSPVQMQASTPVPQRPGPCIESVHEDDDDDLSLGEDCNSNVYLRENGDDDLLACDHNADVYDSDGNLLSPCIESPREDDDEVLSLSGDDWHACDVNTDVYDSDGNLLSPCIESPREDDDDDLSLGDDDWHACD